MSGIEVEVAAWRRHAAHVAALRDRLQSARTAAESVDLGADTFGVVGVLVVGPSLAPLAEAGRLAVELVDDALGGCARGIEEVADLFEHVDTEVRTRFERLREAPLVMGTALAAVDLTVGIAS
ncbi:MAG: hypothetical protein ACI379_15550 [Nocardioides sp.]|uniref:hypothetical protein n=1 Tax=Nocardioides sp. TaxID=35761 RepID=UPI003EFE8917